MVLADINDGEHGLASLYWHSPDEFQGRDVVFVTRNVADDRTATEPYFAQARKWRRSRSAATVSSCATSGFRGGRSAPRHTRVQPTGQTRILTSRKLSGSA